MNRTVFLVDGFNLYHSLVEAHHDGRAATAKWLDLKKSCCSYLPLAGQIGGKRADMEHVYYFSAPPIHRSQDKIDRHALYMSCLRASGVNVQLGRFKKKSVHCNKCNRDFFTHEEKEPDVAIATKLFEICHLDQCDTAILMTGDTDLALDVVTCKRIFPNKPIFFAFPYKRTNAELAKIAPESFSIKFGNFKVRTANFWLWLTLIPQIIFCMLSSRRHLPVSSSLSR
ncbi:NYN domain-containing protein [Dehalococcoidia bacterium]|nr:NYN domain-containing protein [Dehalococcoidia bacterium]